MAKYVFESLHPEQFAITDADMMPQSSHRSPAWIELNDSGIDKQFCKAVKGMLDSFNESLERTDEDALHFIFERKSKNRFILTLFQLVYGEAHYNEEEQRVEFEEVRKDNISFTSKYPDNEVLACVEAYAKEYNKRFMNPFF